VKLKDTGGTDRDYPKLYYRNRAIFKFRAGGGEVRFGIFVGNGTTAVSLDDYKLASKIAHGTGAGQLYYYETNTQHYTDSDRSYLQVYRLLVNKSESNVTVSEVGLGFEEHDVSDTLYYFLILRDLVDPAVTVEPAQTLQVRYIFEFLL